MTVSLREITQHVPENPRHYSARANAPSICTGFYELKGYAAACWSYSRLSCDWSLIIGSSGTSATFLLRRMSPLMAQSGHRDALGQCPLMIQRGHERLRIFARRPAEIYDAELDKNGKALRPDGKQAGTLIAPAFGLAGVNLHTWTGFGSVPYWNAYVGVGEMHVPGTFFDARLNDKDQYPVAAKKGAGNVPSTPDKLTSKLGRAPFLPTRDPSTDGAGRLVR